MNCKSTSWQDVNVVEELLIIAGGMDERLRAAKIMAWNESSFAALYQEIIAIRRDNDYIRSVLKRQYDELTERAREEK